MAERLELLIPERRIRARVMALAGRIDADYRGKRLSLVVVLKGAYIFAADLIRQIAIPFTIDFIAAASYGASTQSSGTVALRHRMVCRPTSSTDACVALSLPDTTMFVLSRVP